MRITSQSIITAIIVMILVACNRTEEKNSSIQFGAPSAISQTEALVSGTDDGESNEGTPGYKYDWTTQANVSNIIAGSGTYSANVTDAQGSSVDDKKSSPNDFISSSAAIEDGKDTIHRFIRTAGMQFKVKSVTGATYRIEDIVRHFGGWVEYTYLSSTISNTTLIPVSKDSSLETTYYTVKNSMQLRVPNTKLDTVLKSIAVLIDFLDHRTIKAEDISLELLAKSLEQKRLHEYDQRVKKAIDEKAAKLKEVSPAEDDLLRRQEQADAAKIAQLNLIDRIQFSAISLLIYQNKSTKRELVYNDKNIDEYKPSFGTRMLDALKSGWHFLQETTLVIVRLWWIVALIVIAFVVYRKLRKFD